MSSVTLYILDNVQRFSFKEWYLKWCPSKPRVWTSYPNKSVVGDSDTLQKVITDTTMRGSYAMLILFIHYHYWRDYYCVREEEICFQSKYKEVLVSMFCLHIGFSAQPFSMESLECIYFYTCNYSCTFCIMIGYKENKSSCHYKANKDISPIKMLWSEPNLLF